MSPAGSGTRRFLVSNLTDLDYGHREYVDLFSSKERVG